MIRTLLVTLTACTMLLTAAQVAAQREIQRSSQHDFEIETVADELEVPWSIAWLPEGEMLVTERAGRLRLVRDGKLTEAPVEGVPEVHHQGQGGLFDVLPHPRFEDNRLLYLSFAKPLSSGSTTAVVRGRFQNDRLSNVESIFEADSRGRDDHYGGRMAFDKDGHLLVTVGDRQAPPEGDLEAHPAQDTSNHSGTVVRLNDDGTVPEDNPFVGQQDALPEIFTYGHRNPQGLAIHPVTGNPWAAEHGPQGGDELNVLVAGNNYGWPVVGFGVNYGPGRPVHATQQGRNMLQPEHLRVPSIATSGLMIYDGELFDNWQGDAFVGGMRGQQLARIDLEDNGRVVRLEETLMVGIGRVRDVRQGPDDAIYLATENRGILRLTPFD